ncbi:16524_t:CDS:1 [Racocetra fulgida]|uniref:16524_t:CDS:1 n=1 Tax=Racocetra fulgida TaxID=60492 RepID=A0A9N9EE46_9GLOM|nr:16524_t:CDS:1 [Racocetra fulgida]
MSFQDDKIPINKLLKNLQNDESSQPQAILLACGSYYPIHKFHIEIFEITKKYLEEKKKYKVVLGYISPSSDKYIYQKYPKDKISQDDKIKMTQDKKIKMIQDNRIKMIKLITNESSWIDITTWELSQNNAIDILNYNQVVKHISTFLNEKTEQVKQALKGRQLKIIYLCGLDQALKKERQGLKYLENYEIAIVERFFNSEDKVEDWIKNGKEKLSEKYKDKWQILENQIFFIDCNNNNEISSTKIREWLKKDDDNWKQMCHPKIVEYIEEKNILAS